MFCTVCGATLDDGAKFCTSCGTPIESKVAEEYAPQPEQPVYTQPEQPVYTAPAAQPAALDKNTLILSIVGLVLTGFGIVGLIISIIAKGKVKKLPQPLTGGNKVAGILSTLGIVFGIIMTIYYVGLFFYAILVGAGLLGSSASVDWSDMFSVIR